MNKGKILYDDLRSRANFRTPEEERKRLLLVSKWLLITQVIPFGLWLIWYLLYI